MNPWLARFKLALIQEDEKQLLSLTQEIPTFDNENEMNQALALISEAMKIFEAQQGELQDEMQKVLKAKKYVQASL